MPEHTTAAESSAAMSNLKLCLQLLISVCSVSLRGFANRDAVMSLPGWQLPFLDLLEARRRVGSALLEMGEEDTTANTNTCANGGYIARNHHIIIVILRIITDLHLHAVRFGGPESSLCHIKTWD